jgi:hypothetical protein
MFEKFTPFRGYIRQPVMSGRLGIAPSLVEQVGCLRVIESHT